MNSGADLPGTPTGAKGLAGRFKIDPRTARGNLFCFQPIVVKKNSLCYNFHQ